ncbi:MAG: DUF1284 domain-containing protein [Nitrospirae bacterium]|nr:DUF1284 domain-containing protein [Nitrospirota bacterium]
MPALRGHHLICLHFFDGEGYGQAFIGNLKDILQKLEYSPVEICSGADDVCIKCPDLKDGVCQYDKNAEEDISAMDDKALELLGLSHGCKQDWDDIRNAVPEIFADWYMTYCKGCNWISVCGKNSLFQILPAGKP